MYIDQNFVIIDFHVIVNNICRLRQYAFWFDYPVCTVYVSFFKFHSLISFYSIFYRHIIKAKIMPIVFSCRILSDIRQNFLFFFPIPLYFKGLAHGCSGRLRPLSQ